MMVVTHITHQIKIMPLFKIWCISRISFYPFYFWILPKLSFIQFSHPLALRAHLMSYSAYSCGISVRMWECVRADIPHMCINGVIPREIKCMSRRNMHILPQKKLYLLCVKRGGKRMRMEVGDTKTSYMSMCVYVETSILWGGSRKYCVVNTLFSVSLPFAPPSSKLSSRITSRHITSYHII